MIDKTLNRNHGCSCDNLKVCSGIRGFAERVFEMLTTPPPPKKQKKTVAQTI